jgi:hypothetical protein
MRIIDDFVPSVIQQEIHDLLLSDTFSWSYCRRIVSTDPDSRSQMVHMFYNNGFPQSDFCQDRAMQPLLYNLNACALIKIKANLQLRSQVPTSSHPHTDHKFPNALTGIYYVNSNDGYTMVGDQKVESVKGRMVIFPSETIHYGTSSTQDRCVINFNYFPQS